MESRAQKQTSILCVILTWNQSTLQYSCLENPKDRGSWRATVCGVTKSRTQLSHRAHIHAKNTSDWEGPTKDGSAVLNEAGRGSQPGTRERG